MKKNFGGKIASYSVLSGFATLILATATTPGFAAVSKFDSAKIEQLTGAKGELNEKEGVFIVRVPRADLQVTTAGVRMNPAMGLTSYAAFMKAGGKTMVMGDTTLLEDQVNPVMSVALDNGLEVTALHNHFFWDSPKVMFMHIGGMGDEERLASAVGKDLRKSRTRAMAKAKRPKPISIRRKPRSIPKTLKA